MELVDRCEWPIQALLRRLRHSAILNRTAINIRDALFWRRQPPCLVHHAFQSCEQLGIEFDASFYPSATQHISVYFPHRDVGHLFARECTVDFGYQDRGATRDELHGRCFSKVSNGAILGADSKRRNYQAFVIAPRTSPEFDGSEDEETP